MDIHLHLNTEPSPKKQKNFKINQRYIVKIKTYHYTSLVERNMFYAQNEQHKKNLE